MVEFKLRFLNQEQLEYFTGRLKASGFTIAWEIDEDLKGKELVYVNTKEEYAGNYESYYAFMGDSSTPEITSEQAKEIPLKYLPFKEGDAILGKVTGYTGSAWIPDIFKHVNPPGIGDDTFHCYYKTFTEITKFDPDLAWKDYDLCTAKTYKIEDYQC